ncbi:MAG TPA: VUT family protein [Mycobacteriales bacterium]|nr:VUT family protein [Mycobacteriales bacterium]
MTSHPILTHPTGRRLGRRARASRPLVALVWALGYAAALAAANVATSRFGLVPAGFGLLVTAGTYTAGLALALRDGLHEAAGVRGVLAALAVGLGASALTADPRIVAASTVATLVGELADLAAYTPLRARWRRTAITVSGAVGAAVDTVGFLWLAGFGLTAQSVGGQVLVKAVWVTAAYLVLREVTRRALPRQRQLTGHP